MIRLISPSRLEAVCDFAANTVDPTCVTCWSDQSTGAYQGGALSQNFTGTTAIVIVAAPASSAVRDVDFINISNVDLITQAITVRYYNGSGTYNLVKVTLASGDRLTYTHASGWQTINSTGTIKSAGLQGATGPQGALGAGMYWAENDVGLEDGMAITYSNAGIPTIAGTLRAFLHTPTSANLAAAVTDEIGSGSLVLFDKTVTASGTTTPQTINKNTGAVNFAAADASKVVTNSLVTANSIIVATVATNDSTMKSVQAVAAAGSFTLYANAAATAETRVNFLVIN